MREEVALKINLPESRVQVSAICRSFIFIPTNQTIVSFFINSYLSIFFFFLPQFGATSLIRPLQKVWFKNRRAKCRQLAKQHQNQQQRSNSTTSLSMTDSTIAQTSSSTIGKQKSIE